MNTTGMSLDMMTHPVTIKHILIVAIIIILVMLLIIIFIVKKVKKKGKVEKEKLPKKEKIN